jgi:hypothetical protein
VKGDSGRGDRGVGVSADSKLSLALCGGGPDIVAAFEELRLVKEAWGREASSEVAMGYRLVMVLCGCVPFYCGGVAKISRSSCRLWTKCIHNSSSHPVPLIMTLVTDQTQIHRPQGITPRNGKSCPHRYIKFKG